ncbi:hypothetical protein [Leadbettera azotonutricia]|uniref:Putative lipoprotein n=1 Tax=Leadbettera azotonutricia (strain ATCC BAA-888 / DSM 13862 / ZAS-9) TaxID=545695 RepID=F5YE98_LEAAZ|nr:hypothetical protein [Leadbettera azotonutricia]AEF81532.1 putative lipoprotein [Leadbettera azotonutricia ZAS-9]
MKYTRLIKTIAVWGVMILAASCSFFFAENRDTGIVTIRLGPGTDGRSIVDHPDSWFPLFSSVTVFANQKPYAFKGSPDGTGTYSLSLPVGVSYSIEVRAVAADGLANGHPRIYKSAVPLVLTPVKESPKDESVNMILDTPGALDFYYDSQNIHLAHSQYGPVDGTGWRNPTGPREIPYIDYDKYGRMIVFGNTNASEDFYPSSLITEGAFFFEEFSYPVPSAVFALQPVSGNLIYGGAYDRINNRVFINQAGSISLFSLEDDSVTPIPVEISGLEFLSAMAAGGGYLYVADNVDNASTINSYAINNDGTWQVSPNSFSVPGMIIDDIRLFTNNNDVCLAVAGRTPVTASTPTTYNAVVRFYKINDGLENVGTPVSSDFVSDRYYALRITGWDKTGIYVSALYSDDTGAVPRNGGKMYHISFEGHIGEAEKGSL